jgi:uncharacterized membrane protein
MNKLREVLNRQKEVLAALESEVSDLENSDLTKENAELAARLDKLARAHAEAEAQLRELARENAGLKNALHEQVYNEKVKIVGKSQEKMAVFFRDTGEKELNRLTALEQRIKNRITNMTAILRQNNVSLNDNVYRDLDTIAERVNFKVTEARQQFNESHGAYSENEKAEYEALKNEQITDEQVKAVAGKNNIERFVGLNLLNKIGIFLIIIGVITAAHYTYVQLSDVLKGIMMFVLGAAMLAGGELMNRKKPNVFSLGITAGGVALLYVALAISFFGLEILGMYPALALCVLITAAAFFLSTRYNSQTILAFSLIGGYLPIFAIDAFRRQDPMIYGLMFYFVVLNALALLVSFKKRWTVSAFIGLALNTLGTIVIADSFSYDATLSNKVVMIIFVLLAFLNYTLIPLVSTHTSGLAMRRREVVLLAINTFVSSLIMYALFYTYDWEDFTGLLALVFAVIYLGLGQLMERKFAGERHVRALFYLTGLAFVVLIVPFQFGRGWLSLGWLAEGVALATYGIVKEEKHFKRYGFIIGGLCLLAFIFVDVPSYYYNRLFPFKYLAITLGSLVILGAYMYKKALAGGWRKAYKYVTIINVWFYMLYLVFAEVERLFDDYRYYHNLPDLLEALAITLTFFIALATLRIKILADLGTKIIAIALYAIGLIWLFVLNLYSFVWGEVPPEVRYLATFGLVLVSLFSVFVVYDLLKLIVMERKLGIEWFPLIVSAYFVIVLTQNLIAQYGLSFASAWISIVYVLTALAWTVLGFAKRYSFVRKFGLGLALLSVAKLFIIDLYRLTQGYQIITYFALGITLLVISFVYQYFNKRLELKIEGVADGETKNN